MTSIGSYAFYGCNSLTSVTIPDSVTSIGSYAFYGCYKLVEVYNLSSLTITAGSTDNGYVGYYAINVYTSESEESHFVTVDDYLFIYDSNDNYFLICYLCYQGTETEIILPILTDGEGNTINYSINQYAFYNTKIITSITIPDSVTSIGAYAFHNCTSLTSVTIGSGVISIGSYAFNGCYKLVEVYNLSSLTITAGSTSNGYAGYYALYVYASADTESSLLTYGDYIFYNDNGTYYLIGYTGNETVLTLPALTVNGEAISYSIYKYAFYYNTKITSIIIPEGVTYIGDYTFYNCTSLTSITIPDSVTSIGNYAFYGCTSLTSVTIGSGVISIDSYAFAHCTSLTSVTIGSGVTSIGTNAFNNCTSLTSITIPDSVTSIGSYAFMYCTSLTSITVDDGNKYYKSIDGNLYSYDGTELIQYAIGKTDTSFIIPDSVTSIGIYAFYGCNSLASVTIGDSVTSIGSSAFYGCTSLTSVTIGDSVTSIGSSAFSGTSLTRVYYSGTVDEWSAVTISSGNTYLTDATIYYYSDSEPDYTDGYNYWRYVDGEIVVWTEE